MSIHRGIDKEDVAHIYTMEYYSAIKKNKIMLFAAPWMHQDCHTGWSKSDRERQIYNVTYLWNLKKKKKGTAFLLLLFVWFSNSRPMVHYLVSTISSMVNLSVNGHKQLVLDSLSFQCSNSDFVVLPVEEFRLVRKYTLNSNNKIKITCL